MTPAMCRFWSKVEQSQSCWLWVAAKNITGYGVFANVGKTYLAHRFAYALAGNSVPDDTCVLHRCDVRNCVNPEHLFLGTKLENSHDMVQKRRMPRGECHHRAKISNAGVCAIRSSNISAAALASMYGVSENHIYKIIAGTERYKQ